MSRIPDLDAASLTPRQAAVAGEIAASRGEVRGPFGVWLRVPDLAETAARLGHVVRYDGQLDRSLFELAVLVVARHWSAQYEWYAHAPHAAAAGLDADTIEAIRARERPNLTGAHAVVHDLTRELLEKRNVAPETLSQAEALLGREAAIELIAAIGYYTMVAFTLVAYDVQAPDGSRPLD